MLRKSYQPRFYGQYLLRNEIKRNLRNVNAIKSFLQRVGDCDVIKDCKIMKNI